MTPLHRKRIVAVDLHGDAHQVVICREMYWWEKVWVKISKRRRLAYETKQKAILREAIRGDVDVVFKKPL